MRRTKPEIKADLEKLSTVKSKVPEFDEYEISNWDMVDAQIQVLKFDLQMKNILKLWPDDLDTQGAAEDAFYWVEGGEVFSPYDRWCIGIVPEE